MLSQTQIDTYYSALLSNSYWSIPTSSTDLGRSAFITYSFPTSASKASVDGGYANSFSATTHAEQVMIRQALKQWSDIAGIKFLEVTPASADIEFGFYNFEDIPQISENTIAFTTLPASGAYVSFNGSINTHGTPIDPPYISLNSQMREQASFIDSFQFTVLHEIGHAIGFKHPFEGDDVLPNLIDDTQNTVLSYTGDRDSTLGPLDIKAAQTVYGTPQEFASHLESWHWDPQTQTLTQVATQASEFLRGTQANDIIDTGGGDDTVVLAGGDDKVIGGANKLAINGGEGFDIAVIDTDYLGSKQDYGNASHYSVFIDTELKTLQTYQHVERIEFNNGTIAFDSDGNAGQAYRLYQAAFDRKPDSPGLGYWIKQLDEKKTNALDMANSFLISKEFTDSYGTKDTLSNTEFITLLYQNVLHRAPETAGLNYWLNDLNKGETWENLLVNFSQSNENINNTANDIVGGIWFV